MTSERVLKLILVGILSQFAFLGFAQLAGGSEIQNSAHALISWPDGSHTDSVSNKVISAVPEICALSLGPDGSTSAPAYSLTGLPGETLYLPYLLKNTGTIASDYTLSLELGQDSPLAQTQIILDTNANQLKDEGEGPISVLNLGLLGQAALLIEVVLPESQESSGNLFINPVASCQSDPSISDSNNLSHIYIPEGGIKGFQKTAIPASGTVMSAGEIISYNLSFVVAERTLEHAVLSDALDANLLEPQVIAVFLNGRSLANAAHYDPIKHEISASFDQLNPGDKLELSFSAQIREDARGNSIIPNQANLFHDDGTELSNEVQHTVLGTCGVQVSPDGDTLNPAYDELLFPSSTLHLPYLIKNTGNTPQTFAIRLEKLPESNLDHSSQLIHDQNRDSIAQDDEPEIETLSLEPGEDKQVLLVAQAPETLSGDLALYDVVAGCANGLQEDRGNISRLSPGLEGASSPSKSADPASGTALFPGASVSYFIDFAARDKDLLDVVVTDTLSDLLEPPNTFSQGTLSDPETGLSTEVSATLEGQTLRWHFERIPAGMAVRLELKATVRTDLSPDDSTLLENTAKLVINAGSTPKTSHTNSTFHPIRPLAIRLEKTAFPDIVRIGEPLTYTLTITNPSNSVAIDKLELSDDLPNEVRYLPNTSVVTLPDGSELKLEPDINGQTLTWHLPSIGIEEQTKVSFDVNVLPAALDNEAIVNTAGVIASDALGRATADAAASVSTTVDPESFVMPSVLLGTVFIDGNGNRIFDQESDQAVEGVRLYLPDGRSVLSDERGRYTFLNLPPGTTILKVDETSLPNRLLEATLTEQKTGLWHLRLFPNELARQDIPLEPAGAQLSVEQQLVVSMGPVKVTKQVTYYEDSYLAKVTLHIQSSEALKDLALTDGQKIADDWQHEQLFELGDVAAGFEKTLSFELETKDITTLLHTPVITWRLR